MDDEQIGEMAVNPFLFHHETNHFQGRTCIETFLSYGCKNSPQIQKSPFWILIQGESVITLDVNDKDVQTRFPLIADLAPLGATEYYASRLISGTGTLHMISLVTDLPGGFSGEQLALLNELIPALSICLELKLQVLVSKTLLDVYVGHMPGQKVLQGSIKPGDMESVQAAIWYSDLRNFTGLSNETEPREFVTWLNEYFACLVESIYEHGGEVLKFIGDAVLAIFPVSDGISAQAACEKAFASAMQSSSRLDEWNQTRKDADLPALSHGIALHYGKVLYGNVGGLKRLDFTVIGATINLAARIESLCGQLDTPLLTSADFESHCPDHFKEAGEFDAKGFSDPVKYYELRQ
jgi:adenylate cyclase